MIELIQVGDILIDCADKEALCTFYENLLGWERGMLYGYPSLISQNGLVLLFSQEEDYVPPVWPEQPGAQQKMLHLDFLVDDLAEAVEKAIAFGAVKAPDQFYENVTVMLDPDGHPFCLFSDDDYIWE